jgi:regulator of sirC expression with transglutaminase-like and TPR domain
VRWNIVTVTYEPNPWPFEGPDPRQLPTPPGEQFRRHVRAQTLLAHCEHVDSERRAEISRELLQIGPEALPPLMQALNSREEHTAALARSLVRLLVPDEVGRLIHTGLLREKSDYSIEYGAALLARLSYPQLNARQVLSDIDTLTERAKDYIYEKLDLTFPEAMAGVRKEPLPFVQKLGEFWRNEGFHGNNEDYYSEKNSLIPDVIERRTGLPIALSVLYVALAKRLHLKAEGVGMPGHFIARICVKTKPQEQYILVDPFFGARPLSIDECRQRVEATGQPFVAEEHLKASPPREVLVRMCNNLLALFDHQKRTLDSERIATILTHLQPTDPVPLLIRAERRLRRQERRSARADLLNALKMDPNGPVARAAEELLRRMDYEYPFR